MTARWQHVFSPPQHGECLIKKLWWLCNKLGIVECDHCDHCDHDTSRRDDDHLNFAGKTMPHLPETFASLGGKINMGFGLLIWPIWSVWKLFEFSWTWSTLKSWKHTTKIKTVHIVSIVNMTNQEQQFDTVWLLDSLTGVFAKNRWRRFGTTQGPPHRKWRPVGPKPWNWSCPSMRPWNHWDGSPNNPGYWWILYDNFTLFLTGLFLFLLLLL